MPTTPSPTAALPPGLADARAKRDRAQHISAELKTTFEARLRKVEPEPDQELPEPSFDNILSECLLALYKKRDGCDKKKKRDALTYYKGRGGDHGKNEDYRWCHISGLWDISDRIKAAHIVPSFLDIESIGEMLFGSRAESLHRAGNALLLSNIIARWFDKYQLVVVPVDATESPITRWRTDLISPDIENTPFASRRLGKELDGKELIFLNEKRPVSRFLYFRFVMTLVHIKDHKRHGWDTIWARYYQQRPFPTPGNYMRKSMLLALATHFGPADMNVVESWIADQGFESPLKLTEDESTEAARRVYEAVRARVARTEAEEKRILEEESSEEGESSEEVD
ncbi:hypothetical protein ACHAPT_005636 [Fusarium lateritium]